MNQNTNSQGAAAVIADDADERAAFMAWYRIAAQGDANLGAWHAWMARAVMASREAQPAPSKAPNFCACCGKRLAAGSIHTCTPPDATEAQGGFLVRVTPTDPEYADVHPQLALEDALRVNPHGWPDGFQFEILEQSKVPNLGNLAVQGEDSARLEWRRITAPGQVKVGDKLRFMIGDVLFNERVKQIINEGRADEELIYNKRRNFYVITSNAITNFGSKNVEFLARASAETGGMES